MIEFREMKPSEASLLMDFIQQQALKSPLVIRENNVVFLSIENGRVSGFLILEPLANGIMELEEIVVAKDRSEILDGLIRSMMHAMCLRSVHWILMKEKEIMDFPLKGKFGKAVTEPELSEFFESNDRIDVHAYSCIRPAVVYSGGCSSNQN